MTTKTHPNSPKLLTRIHPKRGICVDKCNMPILKKSVLENSLSTRSLPVSLSLVYLFFHYFPVCNSGGSAAAGSVSSEVTLKFPLFSPLCLALLWLCLGSSVHQKVVFEELCGSARLRALLSVRAKRKWVAIEEMSRKSILHDIQIWLYTIKRASVDHVFKSSSSLSCELS